MNVEIETEAAQIPEKEYMNGIFVSVYVWRLAWFEHKYIPAVEEKKRLPSSMNDWFTMNMQVIVQLKNPAPPAHHKYLLQLNLVHIFNADVTVPSCGVHVMACPCFKKLTGPPCKKG